MQLTMPSLSSDSVTILQCLSGPRLNTLQKEHKVLLLLILLSTFVMEERVFPSSFVDEIDIDHVVKEKHMLGVLTDDIIVQYSKALTSLSMIDDLSSSSMHANKPLQVGFVL